MANLSISNTFSSGTTAVASQVNTNFSDVSTYINDRNVGISKWDALNVAGNSVIDGTLSVGGVSIGGSVGIDGWINVSETWTYASSTSFTISGDKTTTYSIGDKLKLTNSSLKYFYVIGVSYGAPNTTLTITGGTSYSLANAAITSTYYSKYSSPNGFPGYFTFTPASIFGFSGSPTASGIFSISGNNVTFSFNVDGTSNATTAGFTIPFSVRTLGGSNYLQNIGLAINNGSILSTGIALLSSNGITCYPSGYNTSWTSSGSKQINGVVQGVI